MIITDVRREAREILRRALEEEGAEVERRKIERWTEAAEGFFPSNVFRCGAVFLRHVGNGPDFRGPHMVITGSLPFARAFSPPSSSPSPSP